MDEKIQKIIGLVQKSALDETIKQIIIRDLESSGLTDFLKEQIKAYCIDAKKKLDQEEAEAIRLLQEQHPS